MQASKLIERALRLINVPGRGARLAGADQADAFDTLQELVASAGVSTLFIPGINKQFFPVTESKKTYTIGADPAADFRVEDFGNTSAPVEIEEMYSRSGVSIINNQLINGHRFEDKAAWTLSIDADIIDNQLKLITEFSVCDQALVVGSIEVGKIYTLEIDCVVYNGVFTVDVNEFGLPHDIFSIDETGVYSFDTSFDTDILPGFKMVAGIDCDVIVNNVSLVERGLPMKQLPDSGGYDYEIKPMDQRTYAKMSSKGNDGRPRWYLYDRGADLGRITFDRRPEIGQVLVMDTLTAFELTDVNDDLPVTAEAIRWLRYELANELAGDYGRALTREQQTIRSEAWSALASANIRPVALRSDEALQQEGQYYDGFDGIN